MPGQELPLPLAEYVNQHLSATKQSSGSNWSFAQGFLIGQLSVIIVLSAFIKYFIFGEPSGDGSKTILPSSTQRRREKARGRHEDRLLRKKRSSVLRSTPPLTTTTILSKTFYNVDSHQPETLDWFNVLVAQAIAQFREDARTDNAILASLNSVLNGPHKPNFVDTIKVTEVSLGEDFPIFSNCRICPVEGTDGAVGGKLQARMDVDLSDLITLGIETKLLLNYPKPLVAVLPVALAVSIVQFTGTLSISFVPSSPPTPTSEESDSSNTNHASNGKGSNSNKESPENQFTTLQFSFSDDYRLDISVRSLVGSRSRLQDVPKIAQLVESRIHNWIDERCVEPRFQQIVLPSLWPRKKTTREGPAGTGGSSVTVTGEGSGLNTGAGLAGELRSRGSTVHT
ncbi:hypothetical protein BDZ91DRAFT_709917 [Kalaharituber pfeilii]|nr:hypothetical protein BDZ91DRAFT_709917 [Kalaharituber pfeilii]